MEPPTPNIVIFMNINFVFMYFNLDTTASVLGDEAVVWVNIESKQRQWVTSVMRDLIWKLLSHYLSLVTSYYIFLDDHKLQLKTPSTIQGKKGRKGHKVH